MMKKINIFRKNKNAAFLFLFAALFIINACTVDKGEGWEDERYTNNYEYRLKILLSINVR